MSNRFIRMTHWAYRAFMAQRFKKHGKSQTTRVALAQALVGWHLGMGINHWWTNPMWWILHGWDVAGVRKKKQ